MAFGENACVCIGARAVGVEAGVRGVSVVGGAPDSARRMPTLRRTNANASETTPSHGPGLSLRKSVPATASRPSVSEVFGCCFHIVTLRNYFSFRTSSHHIHLLLLIDRSLQRRCTPPCKARDSTPPAARRRCLCAYHGHMCISSSCVHIIVSVSSIAERACLSVCV